MACYIHPMLKRVYRAIQGYIHHTTRPSFSIPQQAERKVIGKSAQGQEIISLRLGQGKMKVLLVGGIHGNEVGSVWFVRLALQEIANRISQFKNLQFIIVPCLKPDGFAQAEKQPDFWQGGRIGRFNGHQVDLNRNFPTSSFTPQSVWNFGKNYSQTQTVYSGTEGGSEPEIQALLEVANTYGVYCAFFFHTVGRDVTLSSDPLAQAVGQIFAKHSGYRIFSQVEWEKLKQTGTAKEWCEEQRLAYIEIEGTTRWGDDWQAQGSALLASFDYLESQV